MSIFVVRLAGFEKAGLFSLAMTSSNIYVSLASYTVRLYYASDIKERFSDAQYICMRIVTLALSIILCVGVSVAVGYNKTQILVITLFYLYKSAEMLSDILFGTLQRHGKLYLCGYSMTIKSVLSFLVFVGILYFTQNLVLALSIMALLAGGILLFIDIPMARRVQSRLFVFSKENFCAAKRLMIICLPLFVVGLCYNIVPSIPRLAFERVYSAEQFGIYSSISTITVLISTAVNCVALPFIPKMSQYYCKGDKRNLSYSTIGSVFLTVLLGAFAYLMASLFGDKVLIFLFGNEIAGYVDVFGLVIIAADLSAIIICLNNFFVAVEQQSKMLIGCIVGAVLCMVLSLPLCKLYYMNGVAYCLIIAQGAEVLIMIIYILRILRYMDRMSLKSGIEA